MQAYSEHHCTLVASHRRRYLTDACAALMGAKEIRVRDDCGYFPRPVDHKFIQGMESHLPQGLYPGNLRLQLCNRISEDAPTPEFDEVISAYVTRLTGKNPDGSRAVHLLH